MQTLASWVNSKVVLLLIINTLVLLTIWSVFVFSGIFSPTKDVLPPHLVLNSSQSSDNDDPLPPNVTGPKNPSSLRSIQEYSSRTEQIPPLESLGLTKELVESKAKHNIIIMTFGNAAFSDFILNWVKHISSLGLSNFLVGAMDRELLQVLHSKHIPVFSMDQGNLGQSDVKWGSSKFHKIGREKVVLIEAILSFGYELLLSDTDVVWLKNPLPYFARFPEADILTSTDNLIPTVTDDSLEIWQQVVLSYNIGMFHWRPTESAKELVREWQKMLSVDPKIWDQQAFNDLVRRNLGPSVDNNTGLVYAFDRKLKLGILPASIFCSGHAFFVQAMHQQLGLEPYAVHTTFQYSGSAGKRHRLREAMLFTDPPEYYDPPSGLVSFNPSIPKALLLYGERNLESHYKLVNYQLKQIRTGLAIATLLNRTLVMPPLWCLLDRLFFPHPGIIPGSLTLQPFRCPLDHVFNVDVMMSNSPMEKYGRRIDFREYSFFRNPAVPKGIKESWLYVRLCQEGTSGSCNVAPAGSSVAGGVLSFPKFSSEKRFKQVFSSFKDAKVIEFSSLEDAFLGFEDKTTREKFRNRVGSYASYWCCMLNNSKEVNYDMYWDEKPAPTYHSKRTVSNNKAIQ